MHCSIDVRVVPLCVCVCVFVCDVGESAQCSRNRCCLFGHGHGGGGGGGVERSHVLWEEELQTAGGTDRRSHWQEVLSGDETPLRGWSHIGDVSPWGRLDVVWVSFNAKPVGLCNINMQPEGHFSLLWRRDALRKPKVFGGEAGHCFSGSGGEVGWLATTRLLVRSPAPWARRLTLTAPDQLVPWCCCECVHEWVNVGQYCTELWVATG